ncbi:MAG: tetratricopeptide repeat protein [Pseudomonadota bacterium]
MQLLRAALTGIVFLLLAMPAAAKDKREPIVVQDVHYGEVLFHFYKEDYFPAIVRLLAARDSSRVENHLKESELLLGGLYLSYGHHLEAADIFERLLADSVDQDIRDRTWFFLAKIWQQRGYLDRSQGALGNIEGKLPKNLEREARLLQAQLHIDNGEHDRAIALLDKWKGNTEWSRYAQFNLGVALVRSGRIAEAQSILSELGDIDPWNEELTSLRDKANLALGYALLQDGQPNAAKPALSRVRLEGPFSNKALLGVGWADAELESYERALVPWMELRGRDLLDSAVQESMLAIPYALAKLDAVSQAADHYLNAIEAFYEETNRIDLTIDRIESGLFFDEFVTDDPLDSTGWYWQMEELPTGPEARYLFHLLATHEFQEGLKNYRDLNYLYRNLDTWQQNVVVYGNMLETRRQAFAERLPRVEEALARADIDALVDRKLEFDSLLNNIEESNDWLALASEEQFEMWGEITGLENNPALAADIPEAAEVRDKIGLLKGVLQWELEKDFKDRLWRIRRHLRQTGEALVETQRSRRQVDESIRLEPIEFDTLGDRVYGLAPRIERMKAEVGNAMFAQQQFLSDIAVGELSAQKQRLDTYTIQARFALASIYDIATMSEAAE